MRDKLLNEVTRAMRDLVGELGPHVLLMVTATLIEEIERAEAIQPADKRQRLDDIKSHLYDERIAYTTAARAREQICYIEDLVFSDVLL